MPSEPFDLRRIKEACRRHGVLVIAAAMIGCAAAGGVTAAMKPHYEATATAFVTAAPDSGEQQLGLQQATLAQTLVPSYAQLAQTRAVAAATARRLRLPTRAVLGHVRADSETGVQVLRIHGEAASGPLAARIANAAAQALAQQVNAVVGPGVVTIHVVDPAVPAAAPTRPKLEFGLLLGALVGLVVGAALAVVHDGRRPAPRVDLDAAHPEWLQELVDALGTAPPIAIEPAARANGSSGHGRTHAGRNGTIDSSSSANGASKPRRRISASRAAGGAFVALRKAETRGSRIDPHAAAR